MRRPTVKLSVLALAGALAAAGVARADDAAWLRDPAISPDATRVAFTYRGDVWTVPAAGGRAVPLTTHDAVDTAPVWAPDGRTVAFASDRHGNLDVFVVPADGGAERRLTFDSADERPTGFAPDGASVLCTGRRMDDARCTTAGWWPQLWSVPLDGGRPVMVLPTPALAARFTPDGKRIVYEDLRAGENLFRKHHTSSAAHDLWTFDPATGAHVCLTRGSRAEDRDPWVGPDGRLWFLSERGGSFNVYAADLASDAPATAVTSHAVHPVRSLSLARDGTLCYGFDGGIWVRPAGGAARRIAVDAPASARVNDERRLVLAKEATEMAPSPDGEEVAFVVRGDVFVASVEHGTTTRLTDTPGQERMVAWQPDGKRVYYAGERDGSWNLYAAAPARAGEKRLSRATLVAETTVLATPAEEFGPVPSPDGKALAFVRDRDEIAVLTLATGEVRTLLPAARNVSYTDGDVEVVWSPDGRFVAATALDVGRWISSVVVIPAAGGAPIDVTRSGYEEHGPRFSADGRMLTFVSDRFGARSHGSWGSEEDVVGVLLTRAARDRFRLSPEEYDDLLDAEDEDEEAADGADDGAAPGKDGKDDGGKEPAPKEPAGKGGKDGKDGKGGKGGKDGKSAHDADDDPVPEVVVEPDLLEERTVRLSPVSAHLGGHAVSRDGETVLTLAQVGDTWGLYTHRPRTDDTHRIATLGDEAPKGFALSKDGETVFVLDHDGAISTYDVSGAVGDEPSGDEVDAERVEFSAEVRWRGAAAREAMFDHVVRQVAAKFYEPKLHGADWAGLAAHYRRFLPHVADNAAFTELLSELLGELNASHTGAYRRRKLPDAEATASLGLLFDPRRREDGLLVTEVLAGGPADRAGSRLAPGVVLTHVNGVELAARAPLEPLLDRRDGKKVVVRARPADGGAPFEEVVKAVARAEERELLYRRWVRGREALVDRLSGGRVAYVHVRGMDDAGFRRVYQDALGKGGAKDALVVDTRYNGGGWLHDHLIAFLDAREYLWFVPRGKARGDLGTEPGFRWARPAAVVVNEDDYSDAHVFPFAVQALKLAPIVGARVAGTGTAVWWETLIDPEVLFGIPQVGLQGADGRYLENQELVPDVEVPSDPESAARGDDPQLEAAVRLLLETVEKRPRPK